MPKGVYIRTKEHLEKIRKSFIGHIPWNKGKKLPKSMFKRGESSRSWKGGRHKNVHGYIIIYAPNHPVIKKQGFKYILEHRLVMEKHIGRFLESNEIVHHLNGIKDDNRIDNLAICERKTHKLCIEKLRERILFLENQRRSKNGKA